MVDDFGEAVFAHEAHIFADTVEHDDRIVERVADNRHKGCDDVEIDLYRDADQVQDRDDSDAEDHVVEEADRCRDGVLKFKADRDVAEDAKKRDGKADDGVVL